MPGPGAETVAPSTPASGQTAGLWSGRGQPIENARQVIRADIQGLRGVAVLIVVLFHAGCLASGFVGVDVFFVISGFVVTRGLVRALMHEDAVMADVMGEFYQRRVARLLPAFALVAGPVALASLVLAPVSVLSAGLKTAVAGLLLLSNVFLYRADGDYFALGSEANPFLHLWSLSVEEQFYLLFPSMLAVVGVIAARRPGTSLRKMALGAMALLSVVSLWMALGFTFALHGFEGILSAPRTFAFYSPITRAWEFGAGALIALAEHRLTSRHLLNLGVIGAGLFVAALGSIGESTPFPGWVAMVPVLGTAALIVAGAPERRSWIPALLSAGPLVWLGELSYAWYLWHWPVIVFARAWLPLSPWMPAFGGALSLIPAWASHRLVESRMRIASSDATQVKRMKFRSSIAMGLTALLLSTSAVLWLPRSSHPAARWHLDTQRHLDARSGCESNVRWVEDGCSWGLGASEAGPRVLLIGDSNAGQFSETVIVGGLALNRPVKIRTSSGCPLMVGVTSPVALAPRWARCVDFSQKTLEFLKREPPALVVIGLSFEYFRAPGTGRGYSEAEVENARAGFRRFLSQAAALGHELVLVAEIPKFPEWPVALCPAWKSWLEGDEACSFSFSLDEARDVLAENRRYVGTLLDGVPKLDVIDFSGVLCPGRLCHSHSGGALIYRDLGHLSVKGAQVLIPTFLTFLQGTGREHAATYRSGLDQKQPERLGHP